MKKIPLSLVSACLLMSSATAGQIIGAEAGDPYVEGVQYGFGGWNLDNVIVKIVDAEDKSVIIAGKSFDPTDGTYDTMTYGESFESDIYTTDGSHELRGQLHGKDWPVGEPAGVKIINNDNQTNHGKPENCIINTSYLSAEDNPTGEDGYLDAAYPSPVICSSAFQTHKRFKINMVETTVAGTEVGYGKPVELVFNLKADDTSSLRYQVFSKINNYTGMRLDGYKIEVLDGSGQPNENLTLSLGLLEDVDKDGNPIDIWDESQMATFSSGLWGPKDDHFPDGGFFDKKNAGFTVTGHNTDTVVGGPTTLGSNYTALFGIWLPSKWAPVGIYFDDDNDPTTDASIVAFWGTTPTEDYATATPTWHKGIDAGWVSPTAAELLTWMTNPRYSVGTIEDTLNLGLNYIINVGDNTALNGDTITVRITPRVALDQTAPSYVSNMPTENYDSAEGIIVISPSPEFTIEENLSIGVGDKDLNTNAETNETVTVSVTTSNGDSEELILTETGPNTGIFGGIIQTFNETTPVADDGRISVVNGSVVTATYYDASSDTNKSATTTAVLPDDGGTDPELTPSSGGGGCTYNPNSKKFDLMFFMMMALGAFYLVRRKTAK